MVTTFVFYGVDKNFQKRREKTAVTRQDCSEDTSVTGECQQVIIV